MEYNISLTRETLLELGFTDQPGGLIIWGPVWGIRAMHAGYTLLSFHDRSFYEPILSERNTREQVIALLDLYNIPYQK